VTVSPDLDALLRHTEAVRRLARRLVLDDDQADDVLQDACLVAMRRPPPKGVPLRAWIVGIVRNLAAHRRRDEARRQRRESKQDPRPATPEPHEIAARAETHRALVKAVLLLGEPYRTTMLMRFFDGLPVREIAQRLGIPPSTVGTHVHRGLAQLRERLDDERGGRRVSSFLALMSVASRGGTKPLLPTSPSVTLGALIMSTKTLVVGALALLVAAFLFTQLVRLEDAPTAQRTVAGSAGEPPTLAGRDDPSTPQDAPPMKAEASGTPLGAIDRRRDLHGIVVDEAGQAVAGARVETFTLGWLRFKVYSADGMAAKREHPGPGTVAADDGTFRIRLRRDAVTHLRVRAPGFAITERFDCTAGEHVEIVLPKGVRVTVRVVDSRGAPVADAMLRLWRQPLGASGLADRFARTDTQGEYMFADLPPSAWAMLTASHRLFGPLAWRRVEFPAAGTRTVTLRMPAGRTLRGRVVDADTGEPIPGGRVGLGWTLHKAVPTDNDGQYVLHGWTGSFYVDLHAAAPGYGGEKKRGPFGDAVDFRLRRGVTVTGRIVAAAGAPVPSARVALAAGSLAETQVGATDLHGRFELEGVRRASGQTLVLVAPGFGRTLLDIDVPDRDTLDLGDVRMARGHEIEGRVVGADGRPVPEVAVELRGANADRDRLRPGKPAFSTRRGNLETRRTDDRGSFRFNDLAPGTYEVSAKPLGQRYISTSVIILDGENPDAVTLRLRDGCLLRVHVTDDLGAPVAYAHVSAVAQDEYGITCMTDSRGWAAFQTEKSVASVEVTPVFAERDYLAPPIRSVEPDESSIEIVMQRAQTAVGRVLDADGKPVAQAVLVIFQNGEPLTQLSPFSGNVVNSDLEGRFKVLLPERGRVDIVAMPRPYKGGVILGGRLKDVGGDTSGHVLQLHALVYDQKLTVRALTPDGKPASDVQVYARIAGRNIPGANVRTDVNGMATLRGLPDESIVIQARALPGTPEAERWTDLVVSPVLASGQRIDLTFEAAVVIVGQVVDPSGEPVGGAFVALSTARRPVATATSDERGGFRFRASPKLPFPLRLTATLKERSVTYGKVSRDEPGPIKIVLP